jgi:hypothetical protein
MLVLVALGVGAHLAWQHYGPMIAREQHYLLTADNIHISQLPPWIRTDIKTDALRNAGLIGTLSVLDDHLAVSNRLKQAFEFHPWVAGVRHITWQPTFVDIELAYRKPIAAVESSDSNGVMFLPIDENAIRLPEGDLSEAERRYLPRISGITGRPLVGDRWNDQRVLGGAKLASQLADIWQQLRLVEIIADVQVSPRDATPIYRYQIVTTGGTHIVWGMTPGDEAIAGESPFPQKRQRLLDYATQHGKLESIEGPAVLDVRSNLVVTPRTAKHKKEVPKESETQTK